MLDGFERAEATVELGEHLGWIDENSRAVAVLRGFMSSADAVEWPALRIRAEVILTFAQNGGGPVALARGEPRCSLALLTEAEALGDEKAITTCLLGVGLWAFWSGRSARAAEDLRAPPATDR